MSQSQSGARERTAAVLVLLVLMAASGLLALGVVLSGYAWV